MKRITIQLTLIIVLVVLTGCTSILELFPSATEAPISHQVTNTHTVEPTPQIDTPTLPPPSQTPTPTFTLTPQEITMTPTNDLVATIAALQATLEASTKHIATLESEKSSPPSSPSSPSSPTSSSSSTSTTIKLPADVRQVTVIQQANLRISKRNNAVGKPIMSIPKSRIVLTEGAQQYIYKDRVDADGSIVYYEIYDPDGVVTQVLYIRAVDIQLRNSRYNTNYGPIPEGVVYSEVINSKAVMRYIKEYNSKGKPILKIVDPRVVLEKGDQTWIYPSPIISDGGNPFYEIYDPDGKVTNVLYARVEDLYIFNALDQ